MGETSLLPVTTSVRWPSSQQSGSQQPPVAKATAPPAGQQHGWQDTCCLQDCGMERSGEDVCVLLPPPPPGLRDREPDLTIPVGGGWATRPHPSLRVTTLGSRSGSRPSAHSWSPNPRLCVLLFKDSAFCCRYSDDKSKSKSCSLSKV